MIMLNRTRDFSVGFVQFDDIEGPLISHLYPPDFPLDIDSNFEIAGYALYVEGKTFFETKQYFVFSLQFKKFDPKYQRKYRKYAIVIIIANEEIKQRLIQRETIIEEYTQDIIDNIPSNADDATIRELLKDFYKRITHVILSDSAAVGPPVRFTEETQLQNEELIDISTNEDPLQNIFLVDLRLKIILSPHKRLVDEFINNPNAFRIFPTPRKHIYVIAKNNLKEAHLQRIYELLHQLATAEENGTAINIKMLFY